MNSGERNRLLLRAGRALALAAIIQIAYLVTGVAVLTTRPAVATVVCLAAIVLLLACLAVQVRADKWIRATIWIGSYFCLHYLAGVIGAIAFWEDPSPMILVFLSITLFFVARSVTLLVKSQRMRAENGKASIARACRD